MTRDKIRQIVLFMVMIAAVLCLAFPVFAEDTAPTAKLNVSDADSCPLVPFTGSYGGATPAYLISVPEGTERLYLQTGEAQHIYVIGTSTGGVMTNRIVVASDRVPVWVTDPLLLLLQNEGVSSVEELLDLYTGWYDTLEAYLEDNYGCSTAEEFFELISGLEYTPANMMRYHGIYTDDYADGWYVPPLKDYQIDAATYAIRFGSVSDFPYDATAAYTIVEIKHYTDTPFQGGVTDAILLIKVGGASGASVDEEKINALKTAITNGLAADASTYYTSDDRYNGKDADTITTENGSFYVELQKTLTAAKALFNDSDIEKGLRASATEEKVDEAAANLNAAIAKLIPKTEVNATLLYERVQALKIAYTDTEKPLYTAKTWAGFEDALDEAEDFLGSLYGFFGNSGIDRQGEMDQTVADLNAAVDDLLLLKDHAMAEQYNAGILQLNKVFRLAESDGAQYTEATWAAFTAARDDAAALQDASPADENLTAPVAALYKEKGKAYFLACYRLQSAAQDIGVTFRVADSLGARYPEHALTDGKTAAFNGAIALTGGHHGLQDLVAAAGLDFSADMSGAGERYISPLWSIYVNGVAVGDPYDGSLEFDKVKRDEQGQVIFDPIVRDAKGNRTGICNFPLRDGDEIVLVRAEYPQVSYYSGPVNVSYYATYRDYLSLLKISEAGAEAIEVREGESFSLTVKKSAGHISAYPALSRPAANVSLVCSDPAAAEEAVTGAKRDSGVVTDGDGKADLALYQAGWYAVAAADIRQQTLGSIDVAGKESPGVYPNLAGADFVLVHVMSLGEEELAAALDGYQTRLDQLLAQYSADLFGPVVWKQAQSAFHSAKAAIYAADSLAGAQNALDTAKAALDGLLAQANTANAKALSDLTWYLDRLPTVTQTKAGLFNQGDINFYQKAAAAYNGMSSYQKGLVTAAQIAQYQALVAAYGADGSTLPAAKEYTLTVKCEPAAHGDKAAPIAYISSRTSVGGSSTSEAYPSPNLAAPLTCPFAPGNGIILDLDKVDLAAGYEVYRIESSYADLKNQGNVMPIERVFSISTLNAPRADITVTLYIREIGQVTLEEARMEAKDALAAAFKTHAKGDYTVAKWADLVAAYRVGVAAIGTAETKEAAVAAKDAAVAAMAAIEKRAADDYGSVKVEFYNTTYAGGLGYHESDPFVSKTVALEQSDSLMSAALKALNSDGYTWTGTGGSGYNIGYLSTVKKGGVSLGEFDNGSASGWMGTLNDWFNSEGLSTYTVTASNDDNRLRDGDTVKIMYTSAGYGDDLGGTWGNGNTALKSLTAQGVTFAGDFDPAITEYVATVNGGFLGFGGDISVTAIAANKNYQVRTMLNSKTDTAWYRQGEEIPAQAGDVLYIGVGEKAWPSMNKTGAEAVKYTATWYTVYLVGDGDASAEHVIDLIAKLPAADQIKLTDRSDVLFAQAYYKTLSAADQGKVTNIAKLEEALAQLEKLQAAEDVKALIEALPAANQVKAGDAKAIHAADGAYQGLDQAQKDSLPMFYIEKLAAVKDALDNLGYVAPANYEDALNAALSYLQTNVTDPACGSTGGEWAVLALARAGVDNDTVDAWYGTYLANLEAHVAETGGVLHTKKYTEYSRVTLALTSLGKDAAAFSAGGKTYDLVSPLLNKQDNGEYWASWQGNNGTAFALIALDSGQYLPNGGKAVRGGLIDALKASQQQDGGWAISEDTPGYGVDVTGMVLQALAPYYLDRAKFEALGAATSYEELQTVVTDAVNNMKNYTADDYGTSEAAVQVIVALTALNINPEGEDWKAVTSLLHYYDEEAGAFRHVNESNANVNLMGTEQAAYGLVAYDRYLKEANRLYDMTDRFTAAPDATESADQKAANAVIAKIEALPETVTLADEAAISEARQGYDGLSKIQKALVNSVTLTKLLQAEKDLAKLKEAEKPPVDPSAPARIEDMKDIPAQAWYYGDVAYVLANGIMKGNSATTFGPDDPITRSQFVTILGRYAGISDSGSAAPAATKFSDVKASAYYASHVAWAVENGITKGTGATTFAPEAKISRQDMATMIARFADKMEIGLPDGSGAAPFNDDNEISSYAKTAVYSMVEAEIINGVGNNRFAPKDSATRSQAAKIIHLLMEYKK